LLLGVEKMNRARSELFGLGGVYAWLVIAFVLIGPCEVSAEEAGEGRYRLEYPAAEQFCPPVVGFFQEVQETIGRAGGHTFRHQPNGGYGLPVVDKVGGVNLLHLGADVGWYRVGEPVYAVANGIVRASQGEEDVSGKVEGGGGTANRVGTSKAPSPGPSPKGRGSKKLEWGNFVVIEHKLSDGKYATTIYGHLANERLVNVGDEVRAGQQIGTIGTTKVNGGYKPHLHLGVRDGRMAEVGRKLVLMLGATDRPTPRAAGDGGNAEPSPNLSLRGRGILVEIAAVREDAIVLKGAEALPSELQMGLDGRKFAVRKTGAQAEVDSAFLYYVPSPEFLIVGYGLSTEGWRDPMEFLREHGAEVAPAPFSRAARGKQVRTAKGAKKVE
jgi:murein DD-endopeptidase MepM/ murein hydrolase activator NlpD